MKEEFKKINLSEKNFKKEELNMISDIEMVNRMIQKNKGVIDLTESGFKSEYGKKRFNELKHIVDGKPVVFNKEELETIGRELEELLSDKNKEKYQDDDNEENEEGGEDKEEEKEEEKDDKEEESDEEIDKEKEEALEKLKNTKIGIVNIKEIAEAEARKGADSYMTESKDKLKGFSSFFKKMWKHTFFDEYYRQRQINRIKDDIKTKDNIYVGRLEDGSEKAHEDAMKAISERFISEYENTLILSEGEERKLLDNTNPDINKVTNDIKDLIYAYALGKIDEQTFKNEKVLIIDSLKTEDLLKESDNYADNLLEVAKNAKIALEHGAKIEELGLDTNIIIGKAKSSLKTEAHLNYVDKGVDWMKKTKVGRFISPAVLSTALGITYCATSKFLATKTGGLLLGLGGAVAISSAFAGMNESQRVALERSQHGIEMAEGGEFEKGSKRREQMEKYGYHMEKSSNLSDNLRNLILEKGKDNKEVFKNFDASDLDKIFSAIAEIDARNSLNSKKRIDLIAYENIGSVEKERTEMSILVAKAKVELERRLGSDLSGSLKGETYESYLEKHVETIERSLLGGEKGITSQDRAFKKYKTKRVAKKVLQTATFGMVIGGTIQELASLGNENVQGLHEGLTNSNEEAMTQTPLENLREWMKGGVETTTPSNSVVETVLGENVFHLPEGTSIIENPDGTFDIFKGDQLISDNIALNFDGDGNLDAESLARLGESGIIASTSTNVVEGVEEVTNSAKEYITNHPEETSRYGRLGWYDNDTSEPIFDKNELKLWWGGEGNRGLDSNGNYSFDISQMTSDGSFHQDFSVDAQDAMKSGLLKMVFSLTGDTQNQLFELPIGVDGSVNIDPDSEIGKLFFEVNNDGRAVFKGRFAEVVQSFGEKDGVEQIKSLATLEGPGNDEIKDIVKTFTRDSVHHLDIPEVDVSKGIQPPWFIPVVARRPLESVTFVGKENSDKEGDEEGEIDEPVVPVPIEDKTKDEEDKEEGEIDEPVVPVPVIDNIEEEKNSNEISQEEYDGMSDDLKMLNKKIRESKGVIVLEESDFKSEYGKKRYLDLKSISDGIPVRFNKTELQTIGDELEGLLSKSKVISKEEMEERLEKEKKIKSQVVDMNDDLKMLNKKIRESKGIITLNESDFKSDFGKERHNKLKSIQDGKPVRFNKEELQKIGDEMEKYLINYQKSINKKENRDEYIDFKKELIGGKEEINSIKEEILESYKTPPSEEGLSSDHSIRDEKSEISEDLSSKSEEKKLTL